MHRILGFFNKYIAVILFLLLWELLPRLGWVNTLFIPPLSGVLSALWELTLSGELVRHTGLSLARALGGFFIALLAGLPLGLILGGWFRYLRLALEPLMDLFAQTNPVILFHIIMFFLGIGELPKVTIIAWLCVWPITFSTISGIQNIDRTLLKAASSFGLGRWTLFWKVVFPAAAPSIFTGMRLSVGYAFFMLIAAEMMGSSSGLGWLILTSQQNYNIARIFAGAAMIALLGFLSDLIMKYLQKKFIVWQDEASLDFGTGKRL